MWAVFLFERFLRSSEVRGRNTAGNCSTASGEKLANGEALRGSENIENIRKRVERFFGEKRV